MGMPTGQGEDVFSPDGRLRLDLLDEAATEAVREAMKLARDTRWDNVRSPHVFMGLMAKPDASIRHWGNRLKIDLERLRDDFQELFHQQEGVLEALIALNREFLSDNVIRLFRDAHQRALEYQREQITPMDLLITILTTPNSVIAQCFENTKQGVTAAKLTEFAVVAEQESRSS